jgi:hypothetical protein
VVVGRHSCGLPGRPHRRPPPAAPPGAPKLKGIHLDGPHRRDRRGPARRLRAPRRGAVVRLSRRRPGRRSGVPLSRPPRSS